MAKYKKGQSGNPKGRPKSGWGEQIRNHPNAPNVINRIFKSAMDDTDERQGTAWKLLMDRLAPSLKAEQVKLETDGMSKGVIILPEKKPLLVEEEQEMPISDNIEGQA